MKIIEVDLYFAKSIIILCCLTCFNSNEGITNENFSGLPNTFGQTDRQTERDIHLVKGGNISKLSRKFMH